MCHHTECHYISNKADTILYHTLNQHSGAEKLKLRCNIFDDKIGHFAYQTLHCDVTIEELRTRNKNGYKCYMESKKISFKRLQVKNQLLVLIREHKFVISVIYRVLPSVIDALEKMGCLEYFVSLLNCISSNTITENIALNLILDVGQFYRQSTISNMRYRDESIAFWATVQKLFKRKQKQ